jgi:hypothetical protein
MGTIVALAIALATAPLAASASSDLHMLPSGSIVATDILVYQKAGTNLFCRATWGSAFFRFVVLTNASTTVLKDHGEKATVADIKENDRISLTGSLENGADSMTIIASAIQDSALQKADKTVSGTISSVDYSAQTFTLTDKVLGKITVAVSGVDIIKGARTIAMGDVAVGDKIISASGTYDYSTDTLTASSVEVYQDKSVFTPRNFEGSLKSISGTSLPVTLVVSVGSTDYTVYVPVGSAVLKSSRATATLSRFLVGDTIRFYGTIRTTNLTQVDAEVIRDLNF